MEFLIPIGIVVAVVVLLIVFLCSIYKVAPIDKALIITGGKEPKIKVSGGSFVIPIFRKADFFDLCMLTVTAGRDEIKTITAVPIVTDWTAQIRPDTSDMDRLRKAIMSFKERGPEGIINDVKLTLTGGVRDVVASMTPEEVLRDKAAFAAKVREVVIDEMTNMGLELVSLNIQDITDNNHYYSNIAALDEEEKRLAAENKRADVDRDVRTKQADANKMATQNELDAQLAVAEKQRDNDIKQAGFKAETDRAKADANVAGQLQMTKRQQEVAAEEGRVEVVRQEQANLAAQKAREVVLTQAGTAREKAEIAATAEANVRNIQAEAGVKVAERDAQAVKIEADAKAAKVIKEGQADADVIKAKGTATAEMKKLDGLAEAEVTKQRGLAKAEADKAQLLAEADGKKAMLLAEAEGEKARLLVEAEGQQALAEAMASHDKVNFEIEKLKIAANAQITIATKNAEIMAEVGKNAEFVNIGGGATGAAATGNVLLDTMAGIPQLMKLLNVENQALNGKSFNDELGGLARALLEPLGGAIHGNNPTVEPALDAPVADAPAVEG